MNNEIIHTATSTTAKSFAISQLAQEKLLLWIAQDTRTAEKYFHELQFFLKNKNIPIFIFPDRETLPYDHFSPHEDLTSDRLQLLARLPSLTSGIIIAAASTLAHRLAPISFLQQHSFVWKINDVIKLEAWRLQLAHGGYRAVEQVTEHGEFSVRGSIIDIFPMGSDFPFRIELCDENIESMRTFDIDTQKSIEKINEIQLLPAHEYPLNESAITLFRQHWREQFSGNPAESVVYQQISKAQPIAGIEYYLPLFFESTNSFFDYLPSHTQIVTQQNLHPQLQNFWKEIDTRYTQYNIDSQRPLCKPIDIFIPANIFFEKINLFSKIMLHEKENIALPDLQVDHRQKNTTEKLRAFLQTNPGKILICAESAGRREVLHELFYRNHITVHSVDSWDAFLQTQHNITMTVAPISESLFLKDEKIIVITEAQLFGQSFVPTYRAKKKALDPATLIKSLAELQPGALVVHIDHGIGKYIGLEKIKTDEIESEYVTLEYADHDRVYVPIQSLHVLSRYSAGNTDHTVLNKLGTHQWEKTKKKALTQIRDTAAELLKIYSEREASTGFSFPKPAQDFLAFRRAFPFEETEDQTQAINAVIDDMTKAKCMDRLVCGDVGFGKTEVAMQAAFLAVMGGKQVAVLVPTTLLANQHADNFRDRFSQWPIKIEWLTRLQSSKQQKEIIEKIKSGSVDIVIGTHKLLNQHIQFHDLGLLIVDEEHRFGVQQKERVKAMRAHVDILTLTATPIPRTLNLSMSGMRDLSIIATPPAKRLSIKTFVHEYNHTIIREAIVREMMRGGQVYFLHNDVDTMPLMLNQLQQLIPEAKMTFAHGQMREHMLEKTMSDFYHQRFQVLICSTIIESGIDVPSANTIIINNADRFGLAQLHQIRGRVGRSHHQAYAYLLVKDFKALTQDATKRLDAIAELEDLGVGFQLATYDLEIRGAGELLGESQSGHIESIGFSLYIDLLDETVNALKLGKKARQDFSHHASIEINLPISNFFPESYIPDVSTRLAIYKRLSACETHDAIDEIYAELIDRFGLMQDFALNLFSITHLKIDAKKMGITKIEASKQFGVLHFNDKPAIDSQKIIQLIQKEYKTYQLAGKNMLRFKLGLDNVIEQIKLVMCKLV